MLNITEVWKMEKLVLKDLSGNEYKMNRRLMVDRFLIKNLKDEFVYYGNGIIRIGDGKGLCISLYEKGFAVHYRNSTKTFEFDTVSQMIENLKKELEKYNIL
ncbi:MAG: hypothetical protein [Circular genetic element sp.]|nr:MAG: hypothetical protein [Circular genetic element sp.]